MKWLEIPMYTRKWLWMSSHIYTNKFSVKSQFFTIIYVCRHISCFLSSRRVVTSQNKMKKKFNQKTHFTTMYVTHSQKNMMTNYKKKCLKNFVIVMIVVIFKTKQIAKWIQKKKEIFKILKKTTNPYLLLLLQLLLLSVESRRFELSRVESSHHATFQHQ